MRMWERVLKKARQSAWLDSGDLCLPHQKKRVSNSRCKKPRAVLNSVGRHVVMASRALYRSHAKSPIRPTGYAKIAREAIN